MKTCVCGKTMANADPRCEDENLCRPCADYLEAEAAALACFVEKAKDAIRDIEAPFGCDSRLIAKVEALAALDSLKEEDDA